MAKDRDELEREIEDIESNLSEEEQDALKSGDVELSSNQDSDDAAGEQRFELGYKAVARAEREKDGSEGLSQSVAQKYLKMGRQLLDDGSSTKLDQQMRGRVEGIIGRDAGNVRIHTGERAQKAADALGAQAFSLGDSDVFFGRGVYAPHTTEGLGVLVHELTHATDSQVGAAFHTDDSRAKYSQAEASAERNQAAAEEMAAGGSDAQSAGDAAGGKPKIDMVALEDKVYELLQRGQSRAGLRHGKVDS